MGIYLIVFCSFLTNIFENILQRIGNTVNDRNNDNFLSLIVEWFARIKSTPEANRDKSRLT